ncbi:MAG: type II toxin-antitoxin system RelE/ParE family toxin [Nitrospira sp.]|nr:type II toxin-antitoxin system RelE/ParE family toxin [Nitrospira sp.]
MPYEVVFPSERIERVFQKSLEHVPAGYREAIVTAIRSLANNPKPQGKRAKRLTGQLIVSQFTAEYRLRIGPYRVLYDVDDQRKKVVILKLAKRDEHTYK